MIADQQLSDHFSLYELTQTTQADLQELNRTLTDELIEKGRQLAKNDDPLQGLECARALVIAAGGTCLFTNSAYRCPKVNGGSPGSSSTSQHVSFEAFDGHVPNQTIDETFLILLTAARAGKFKFGQLIIESADRGYKSADGTEAISRWVHFSLIGTLNPAHVGQVMKATWNAGAAKFDYVRIDQIKFA